MSTQQKDTVYVDVDEEITGIIDKVRSSDNRIVALVLPKRAAVLQSVVNMKLLKRTADNSKKRVVLITSEAGLLPLAGAVGMYVAKNLQSKPFIPNGPGGAALPDALAEDEDDEFTDSDPDVDKSKSVGELSKRQSTPAAAAAIEPDEDAIEVDNSEDAVDLSLPPAAAKAKKKGKFKIPNFEKFRLLVLLGGAGVVLLVVGLYFAIFVMPSAKITIKTDSTTINSNIPFTASTQATEFNQTGSILPAKRQEVKKTDTEKSPATGTKDIGTKSSGSVTFTNCSDAPVTIAAGTGVSSNNLTFITQTSISLDSGNFTSDKSCKTAGGHVASGQVVAQNNGDQYNLAARDYAVTGNASVKAHGDAMSGGTSKIVKVVAQADVDAAKQKLTAKTNQGAADELKKALKTDGMFALADTLVTGEPVGTVTPQVGEEATEVTVTSAITYTMVGVKENDLKKLVEDDAKKQIDTSKQSILDNGLGDASFVVDANKKSPTDTKLTVQALVKAGPQLDTDGIKREVAGKKKGETITIIRARPGIKDITVSYSPFWVSKTPKKQNKITIIFDQTDHDAKP